MNKKQMLKEQRKYKEQKKEVERLFKDDKDMFSSTWKNALGVILFLALAFCVINVLNGNWNIFTKSNQNKTEIDPTMVIAGTMFNRSDDEYLVFACDMSNEENDFYSVAIDNYNKSKKLFYLDLSSGFNDKFVKDKTVISNDLEKLQFAGPTLLVIKGNEIVSSYTTEKDILDYLSK